MAECRPARGAAEPFGLPLNTAPMEGRSKDALPMAAGKWQYEPKWDGFRCLAFREGKTVELRGKSKPLGRFFPEIVALLRTLPFERFVVDGELVIETDGRLFFDALQMRLHPAESRIRKLASETPLASSCSTSCWRRMEPGSSIGRFPSVGGHSKPSDEARRSMTAFSSHLRRKTRPRRNFG